MEALIGADFPKKVIPLLDSAKKNIDIVVYDWRWYANQPAHPVQQFNAALVRAVQRGILVRAVVNAPLLLPVLTSVGIRARQSSGGRVIHAKMIIIDDEILILGSHNFTRNAFGSNVEVSAIIPFGSDGARFRDFFNRLYGL